MSGQRASRPEVTRQALVTREGAAGHSKNGADRHASELEDGPHVSAETSRRIACDASTVVMRHGTDGRVLDVGRKTRTVSPALRRALATRDRHCRFPGCTARHTDAHHVRHWADGGATALDNLVLLCRRHHRAVHEEGFDVVMSHANEPEFQWPDGRPLPIVPPPPAWAGLPLEPVTDRLRRDGVHIAAHTATPHWLGERLDEAWAIDVLWRPPASGLGASGPRPVARTVPPSAKLRPTR